MRIDKIKLDRRLENCLKYNHLIYSLKDEYVTKDYIKEKWNIFIGCDPIKSDIYEISNLLKHHPSVFLLLSFLDKNKINSSFENGLNAVLYNHLVSMINDRIEIKNNLIKLNREFKLSSFN